MRTWKAFLLPIGVLFLSVTLAFCQKNWGPSINGEGPKVTETLTLDPFTSIGLAVSGTVYITKGSPQKVTVEGQKNIIDNLKREVKGGSWEIGMSKNARNYESLTINITVPDIEGLSIAGSGKIIGQSAFEGLDDVDMSIAGSGTIEFSGSAEKAKISIAGSGDIKAAGLKVTDCNVDIAGSGDCHVDVQGDLNVSIAGSGNVNYKGRPRVSSSIAGSGKVRTVN